jgi:hypothetical protein
MQERFGTNPVTVAAALHGAFAVMAARIAARQDSRLLVDNELVAAEVCELASLALRGLDERAARDDGVEG